MLHFFKHGAAQKAKPAASILETYPDKLPDELFERASYDPTAGEHSGYSNYSYWKATLRAFFKNKVAVFFLIVVVISLIQLKFTRSKEVQQ